MATIAPDEMEGKHDGVKLKPRWDEWERKTRWDGIEAELNWDEWDERRETQKEGMITGRD